MTVTTKGLRPPGADDIPPKPDTTINSELILNAVMKIEIFPHGVNYKPAVEALTNLIAHEANKAVVAEKIKFMDDIEAGKIPYFEGVVIPKRQQQLLTELLGEADMVVGNIDDPGGLYVPVSVIERLQNKTNDGGRNGD